MDPLTALAGALTGLLVGLTGVGGGALMTPILLLVFGIAPLTAVGTDLWFAALTKLAAARLHHARGLVDWRVVRRLWTGSLPASMLALALLRRRPLDGGQLEMLTLAIGAAVVGSAIGMFAQRFLQERGAFWRRAHPRGVRAWQITLTVAAGAAIGALVTVTSIGAGALGAVALAYLYPYRLTSPRLVATDIVHAIPLAVFAGLGHVWLGHVDWGLLANLLIGSIPAVLIGARLSATLPHRVTRMVLASVLAIIGARLLSGA